MCDLTNSRIETVSAPRDTAGSAVRGEILMVSAVLKYRVCRCDQTDACTLGSLV